jgi:asparagine synthase (glutamine-hydrolysing)
MCGLVAWWPVRQSVDREKLDFAVSRLNHRGPDAQRVLINDNGTVGLAHARLSIIAMDDPPQPVSNEDGSILAIVNGEFYDFERIRNDLQNKGHRFQGETDSEILVHLYEEFGFECLTHLRGEFAFVLWDSTKQLMFAARDRFGIKPLVYYHAADGSVAFASEAKALFALGVDANWDEESFFHCASMQYVLPERTLFRGIKQIPPGKFVVVKSGGLTVNTYWDLNFPFANATASDITEQEAITEIKDQLIESIRLRLRADTPVCTHLSGGLDSASIAGIAARLSSSKLHCFSVSFSEDSYDERLVAQRMANHIGAEFHAVPVRQSDIINHLEDAVYYSEGLAVNGHLPAKFLLHKAIHKAGFRVTLSGEGADEVFAGYAHLRQDIFKQEGRSDALTSLALSNKASTGIMLKHGASLSLQAVENRLGAIPSFLEAKGSFGHKIYSVLMDDFKARFAGRDAYYELLNSMNISEQLAGRPLVSQSTYLWTKTALTNYILKTLGDGTEMASSVEGRVPFLDHCLFESAKMLPISVKIKDGREKFVLREAVKEFVTDEIYKREKHPFVAPPLSCFSDESLQQLLWERLDDASALSLPFFDKKNLAQLQNRLKHAGTDERSAYDPVFMTILSAAALGKRFSM